MGEIIALLLLLIIGGPIALTFVYLIFGGIVLTGAGVAEVASKLIDSSKGEKENGRECEEG